MMQLLRIHNQQATGIQLTTMRPPAHQKTSPSAISRSTQSPGMGAKWICRRKHAGVGSEPDFGTESAGGSMGRNVEAS